ncbi:unnamed protein product [Ranitomeya imitator]|uniref:Uncharacterized protein n=1 Tax=Ranitomeya imitator TaxID=111125 RepID=A0ABN9KX97_9NEOB|nr:unnamed protein product [Ranitomeya imitator]
MGEKPHPLPSIPSGRRGRNVPDSPGGTSLTRYGRPRDGIRVTVSPVAWKRETSDAEKRQACSEGTESGGAIPPSWSPPRDEDSRSASLLTSVTLGEPEHAWGGSVQAQATRETRL